MREEYSVMLERLGIRRRCGQPLPGRWVALINLLNEGQKSTPRFPSRR